MSKGFTNIVTGQHYTEEECKKALEMCRKGLSTKEGLLYSGGEIVELPLADAVAAYHGFYCVEQLVAKLEKEADHA